MLQQTRIGAVIPKYEAFLAKYPSFEALASADEDAVLKLWEGLGYYARARNLMKAAKLVAKEGFPSTYEGIRALPGIGDYTAAAIASICFDIPKVAVDGNLVRVYARLNAVSLPMDDPSLKKDAASCFLPLLKDSPGYINQALMEVGETVCLPNGSPKCEECPFRSGCKARRVKGPTAYPLPKAKKARKVEEITVFLLSCGEEYALEKRPPKGLLASLYGFPTLEGKRNKEEIASMFDGEVECLGESRFLFTHREWQMTVYRITTQTKNGPYPYFNKNTIREELSLPSAFAYPLSKL